MTKRRDLLGELAARQSPRPGAREQIAFGQEPEEVVPPLAVPAPSTSGEPDAPTYVKKTYLLEPDLVRALAKRARHERVPINAFARFLLRAALEQVERGDLEVPELIDNRLAEP